jgi:hypothetical protein
MFYQCNPIILLPKLKNALMAIFECGRKKLSALIFKKNTG